ncbi:DUF3916 domain-containing protein [Pseudomonas nitroreducens]|uniref:DUF3916 domain-containing protein n=1 Tax=Pseudomonas nitroreducens TaxID=46680 RepID=A0ABS0KES4_PSENT|nr:DUF3916 domain-containing protein [Pseudomonas nitroreducens]NMZ59647.1 DUF3916 domain-containing protein [Pseudomonas nitroreducens]NNN22989.1 DUF3916 domain-containing protein [Pseudomonas nitroreducens]
MTRRLRALKKWSDSFQGHFPADIPPSERYWNWKIPVACSLVQGRYTTPEIQAQCAQALIDACQHLIHSKPELAKDWRVTAVICIPDFFTSEVCIYKEEGYFLSHTRESDGPDSTCRHLTSSLAEEWKLQLVSGSSELGVYIDYADPDQPDGRFICQRWYFGEVMPR